MCVDRKRDGGDGEGEGEGGRKGKRFMEEYLERAFSLLMAPNKEPLSFLYACLVLMPLSEQYGFISMKPVPPILQMRRRSVPPCSLFLECELHLVREHP